MKKTLVLALAAIMVLGVAGAAFAEGVTFKGGNSVTSTNTTWPNGVTVSVQVPQSLHLTVDTGTDESAMTVDFGNVAPETLVTDVVSLEVKSNEPWTLSTDVIDGDGIGLETLDSPATTDTSKNAYGVQGTWNGQDTYTLNVPFTLSPGTYTASVKYTVTQGTSTP